MSQLFVDNIKNRTGGAIGAPSGAVVIGVVTATSFDGPLTGNITGVAATFTGNVSIGGTLTYEDVTNIDSIGIVTARSGVRVNAGGLVVTAGVSTLAADLSIADKIIHTGDTNTAIRFPAVDTFTVETAGSERVRVDSSGNLGINATALSGLLTLNKGNVTNAGKWSDSCIALHNPTNIGAYSQIGFGYAYSGSTPETYASAYMGFVSTNQSSKGYGDLVFGTRNVSTDSQPTERLRIDSRGSILFKNGLLTETVKINTTARTGTQVVNLIDGNVHFFTTASAATWKPNFTMSTGSDINDTISTGESFSVTMMVAKGATSHFANSAEVDGTTIGTIEFLGGAPTDGGGSGTYDVYSYTIIKTGDNAFFAFASVSKYE
jgi:hypothetical protein